MLSIYRLVHIGFVQIGGPFWPARHFQNVKDGVVPPKKCWYADDAPWRTPRPPHPDAPYDGWSDPDNTNEGMMESRWNVPLQPGEHPRACATRLGFPVDVIEDVAVDFMSEERIAKFATPMTPGESLREWAERVGYPPVKVDEIVDDWHYKMYSRLEWQM